MKAKRSAEHQRQVMELRRSSATQKHVPEKRKGTRAMKKARSMKEWE